MGVRAPRHQVGQLIGALPARAASPREPGPRRLPWLARRARTAATGLRWCQLACTQCFPLHCDAACFAAMASGGRGVAPPHRQIAGATACRNGIVHGATRGAAAPRQRVVPCGPPAFHRSAVSGVGGPAPDQIGICVYVVMMKEVQEMAMDMNRRSRKEGPRRRNWKMAVFGLQLLTMEFVVHGEAETASGRDGVGVRSCAFGAGFTRTSTPIGIAINVDARSPRSAEGRSGGDIGVAQLLIPARSSQTSTSPPRIRSLVGATANKGGQCVCDVVLPTRSRDNTHRPPAHTDIYTVRFRARTATVTLHANTPAGPLRTCTLVLGFIAPLVA